MLRTVPITIVLMLSIVLGGAVVVQHHQLVSERAQLAVLALAAENVAAERDSTRSIASMNRRVAELLGDSLRLFEKRVLQVTQTSDALDGALGRERRAAYAMNVVIDSLRQVSTAVASTVATTDATGDVRRARFDIWQAPYSVAAQVEIPEPPDSARLALQVSLDTIKVGARLTCAAPDAQGIRAALIVASTPLWATLRFGQVEQSPDVCMTPATQRLQGHHFAFKPLSIGVGRAVMWGGSSGWALFVGAVITIS